jgi:prephenate dehydrogenase
VMGPDEHDRAVAATSHLPQLVSSALAASVAPNRRNAALAGPGFRSATRLALSPYAPMWRDIFLTNKKNIKKAMQEFEKTFHSLRSLDDRRLARVFEAGRRTREKLTR